MTPDEATSHVLSSHYLIRAQLRAFEDLLVEICDAADIQLADGATAQQRWAVLSKQHLDRMLREVEDDDPRRAAEIQRMLSEGPRK